MTQNNSSRNIPLTDLYSALQFEFLSYFVRSKIYCKNFIDNYSKVCKKKKEKIENISIRNNLPSIFNSQEKRDQYLDKFLGGNGVPSFTYKDDEVKNKMQRWDEFYFFSKGVSVSFVDNSDRIILGIIELNNKFSKIVTIKDEFGNYHDLHYSSIKRIFPEDFFNF